MPRPLKDVSRLNSFLVLPLVRKEADTPWFSKGLADGSYAVFPGNAGSGGGAGPHDIRRKLAAGIKGDGCEVRPEAAPVTVGLADDMDDGRDGKSCESLLDPDVFFRVSGGRVSHGALPRSVTGDPTRRAAGIASIGDLRPAFGEPIWSGDGTSSIAPLEHSSFYNVCDASV